MPSKAAPIRPEKSHASAIFALTSVLLTLLTPTMFQAISTVVIPWAVADLHGFSRYPWPSTTFALTSAIAMLVFAKLSDLYGPKWIYLVNTGIFVGSLFVGPEHMGVATGLTQFVTALGGTIGLATCGAILLRTYHMHVDSLIPPGLPKDLAFAFGDPLRLVSQRVNLETGFSRITNGSALLARLIEGSRAGLVSGVHLIFLLSSGLMVTSMVVNLFLTEALPRKES